MHKDSNISRRRKTALSEGGMEYTAKRDDLIRIAASLFREKGYKSTHLRDIAEKAGIDRASLYYYIGNKEELFRSAVESVLLDNLGKAERIAKETGADVTSRLCRIFELLMASYEQNFPQMYVYIQEQMHQVSKEESPWAKEIARKTKRLESLVLDLVQQGIASGEFRDDVPPKLVVNALFGMFNWTHRWFTPAGPSTAEQVARSFNALFFGGLRRRDLMAGS